MSLFQRVGLILLILVVAYYVPTLLLAALHRRHRKSLPPLDSSTAEMGLEPSPDLQATDGPPRAPAKQQQDDVANLIEATMLITQTFTSLRDRYPDSDVLRQPAGSRAWVELPREASGAVREQKEFEDRAHRHFCEYLQAIRIIAKRNNWEVTPRVFPLLHPAIHGQHIFDGLEYQSRFLTALSAALQQQAISRARPVKSRIE